MLVSEVLDRTLNGWLHPAGINRPAYDTLSVGIDAVVASGALTGKLGADAVPDKTMVEIGTELLLTGDNTGTTLNFDERGAYDTDAAAHLAGAKVTLEPDYPRQTLLDTLTSVLSDLFAWGVYWRRTDTATTFATNALIDAPVGTQEIKSIVVLDSADEPRRLLNGKEYEVYHEWSPPKIKLRYGSESGSGARIVYASKFDPITAESDDLTTLGVPEGIQSHLPMAIAGYTLQGREVPRVVVEEIKRMLSPVDAGVQVGATLNVGQALLDIFKRVHVGAERARLQRLDPLRHTFVGMRG